MSKKAIDWKVRYKKEKAKVASLQAKLRALQDKGKKLDKDVSALQKAVASVKHSNGLIYLGLLEP